MYSLFNSAFSTVATSLFRTDFEVGGSTEAVELVWDWRLARIYDGENQIVDECIWGDERSISMTVVRLKKIQSGRMTDEARTLFDRFPEAEKIPVTSVEDWPPLNSEETQLLHNSSLILAEQDIIHAASEPDYRLDHLVRVMDESRSVANNLESQLVDWLALLIPGIDIDKHRTTVAAEILNSSDLQEFAKTFECQLEVEIKSCEWDSIHSLSVQIQSAKSTVKTVEGSVHELAKMHLPSLSTLLGPLIAAQLCVTAHGLARLARMPSSTIQVLGAEKSFFSHLQKGTKPPKHGYIFQHTWISRSPKSIRGSISRMLASKAAIAARVDFYGGEPWGSKERSEIELKVGEIRKRKKRA